MITAINPYSMRQHRDGWYVVSMPFFPGEQPKAIHHFRTADRAWERVCRDRRQGNLSSKMLPAEKVNLVN